MKKLTYSLFFGLLACAAGCVVSSVYPFYFDKDVVFDPALLGAWTSPGKDPAKTEIEFVQAGPKEYRITQDGPYSVRLFRLRGQLFLDSFPASDKNEDADHAPVHRVFRVDQIQPHLRIAELSHDWLLAYVTRDPKAIAHVRIDRKGDDGKVNTRVVLTAPTKKLQRFLITHLKTKEAWGDTSELDRRKPSTMLRRSPAWRPAPQTQTGPPNRPGRARKPVRSRPACPGTRRPSQPPARRSRRPSGKDAPAA